VEESPSIVDKTPEPEDNTSTSGISCDGHLCLDSNSEADYALDTELTISIPSSVPTSVSLKFNTVGGGEGNSVKIGKFADGSYWVAPSSPEASLVITELSQTGGSALGADVDPVSHTSQGVLDANNKYGTYVSSEDVTKNLPYSPSLDREMLMLAVVKDEVGVGNCGTVSIQGGCIYSATALALLKEPPLDFGKNSIRPPITGGNSKPIKSLNDFKLDAIPIHSGFTALESELHTDFSYTFEIFKNSGSEGGRAFRSDGLVSDYGSGVSAKWFNLLARIASPQLTLEQKKKAIASMLTYGQDCYYGTMHPASPIFIMSGGAGQSAGIGTSCFFYAGLVKDAAILAKAQTFTTGVIEQYNGIPANLNDTVNAPSEYLQINVGPNGPVWGDNSNVSSYWASLFARKCYANSGESCNNGGPKNLRDPHAYIDGPERHPGASYMRVTIGVYRSLSAAMALMPFYCSAYNMPKLIQYTKRVAASGVQAANDPCAPPDPREGSSCEPYRTISEPDPSKWLNTSNCQYYTVTWGPNPNNPSQCIPNNTGGNTGQTGRFPTYDGAVVSGGYTSGQWEREFTTIMNADSCAP